MKPSTLVAMKTVDLSERDGLKVNSSGLTNDLAVRGNGECSGSDDGPQKDTSMSEVPEPDWEKVFANVIKLRSSK